tara:strand:- start:190 stop:993 length:804 start_codon:yes stop_codon:yes gene_type:complete
MKQTKKIKNFPFVSIIMNCHNGEKYLKKSIKSVINQSYKNWELIFWDNKSTDNTVNILKDFKDERIKYFSSNKYEKLYKARNLAIKKSKGNFICFLDVDDFWNKKFIQNHLNKLNNKECEIVYSKFTVFDENKNYQFVNEKNSLPSGNITQSLLNKYKIGILAIMLKKKIFDKYKFDKNYQIIGDFDFFIKLSMKHKFYCINASLSKYRIHSNNFTNKNLKIYIEEYKRWLKKNEYKLKKLKYNLVPLRYYILKLNLKYFFKKIFYS